jgi:integrase
MTTKTKEKSERRNSSMANKERSSPPYVVKRSSGWYWQPTKSLEKMGFPAMPLGSDTAHAFAEGWRLNNELKKERERLAREAFEKPAYEGTWQHLVDCYRGEPSKKIEPCRKWQELAEATRSHYSVYLDSVILPAWGMMLVAKTTTEGIAALHEGMAGRPYAANALVRTCSAILNFALSKPSLFGLKDWARNPAEGVQKFGKKAGVNRRTQQWGVDIEARFLEAARENNWEVFMGYVLLIYTGQRLSDVLKMKPADIDGDKIVVVQQKTGARVGIHQHAELKAMLAEHTERRRKENRIGGTLLQDTGGQQFTRRKFSTLWDEVESKAGLEEEDIQRRDLRRTAVIRLAEAGCTDFEIASITGHSLAQIKIILEVYWVATDKQAKAAIIKLEASRPYLAQKENEIQEKLES